MDLKIVIRNDEKCLFTIFKNDCILVDIWVKFQRTLLTVRSEWYTIIEVTEQASYELLHVQKTLNFCTYLAKRVTTKAC